MSQDEIIDIVDENDVMLYSTTRRDSFENSLRCRVAHVFLIERVTQKIILLVRSKHTSFRPLHYGAIGGYVLSGESWEDAISREVREEAGIDIAPHFLGKVPAVDPSNGKPFMDGVYAGFVDRVQDLRIDPEAVDHLELFSLEELQNLIKTSSLLHPMLTHEVEILSRFYSDLIAQS